VAGEVGPRRPPPQRDPRAPRRATGSLGSRRPTGPVAARVRERSRGAMASASVGSLLPERLVRIRSRRESCGGTSRAVRPAAARNRAAAAPKLDEPSTPMVATATRTPSQAGRGAQSGRCRTFAQRAQCRARRPRRRPMSPCAYRSRSRPCSASVPTDTMDADQVGSASSESTAPMRPRLVRSIRGRGHLETQAIASRGPAKWSHPPSQRTLAPRRGRCSRYARQISPT
jgi:hypothetical protein